MKREIQQEVSGVSQVFSIQWNQNKPEEQPIVSLAGVGGHPIVVEVPAEIEIPAWLGISWNRVSVTAVEKKAFLSKKSVKRILLPDTIRTIGEWAFAFCSQLEEVSIPRDCVLGKALFLDCESLRKIRIGASENLASLLATIANQPEAWYLMDPAAAGSDEWYAKWDARMMAILHASDMEGYAKQILCGEEDYGSTDQSAFASKSRQAKVRLVMQRLLHPDKLPEAYRFEIEEYLRAQQETWIVTLEEHGDDRPWYECFVELGCLQKASEQILMDLGNRYPEMKAYFIQSLSDESGGEDGFDFFADLEL